MLSAAELVEVLAESPAAGLGRDVNVLVASFHGNPCNMHMYYCDMKKTTPCITCHRFFCNFHLLQCMDCPQPVCYGCQTTTNIAPCFFHGYGCSAARRRLCALHIEACGCPNPPVNCKKDAARCLKCNIRLCPAHGDRVLCTHCAHA